MGGEGIPIWRAIYRVLVIKALDPKQRHERVVAICLERNLVGRGADAPSALDDLAKTFLTDIGYEWKNLQPSPVSDPDPELLSTFEQRLPETPEGEIVLQRVSMNVEFGVVKPARMCFAPQGDRWTPDRSRVTYEPCLA